MSKHNDLKLISSFKSASLIMSIIIPLIGVMVVLGWIFDISLFKSLFPNYIPMKPNSALCFILIGISLLLQHSPKADTRILMLGKILGIIISLFGIISLIEFILGINFHLTSFLLTDDTAALPLQARPAQLAALNFILIGLALLFFDVRHVIPIGQFLAFVIGLIGLLILTGYIFSFHPEIFIQTYSHSSIYTGFCFVLTSLSLLFSRPAKGIMSVFISETNGGSVARRLIPLVILVPILLGYFRLLGQYYNLYIPSSGVEFYSTCIIATLIMVTWFICSMLMTADLKRLDTEAKLQQSNDEFHRIEQELRASEERFYNAMDTAPIGMAIVSLDGKYVEVNQALCQLLGYSKEELLQMTFQQITHPDDVDIDVENAQKLIEGKIRLNQIEKRYIRKNGEIIWVQLIASVLRDTTTNDPLYFIAQVEDITDRKLTEERILHLAYHDSLTNLPNRRLLLDRLHLAMDFAKRHHNLMALMFLDLDRFKEINDSLGHDVGDELLKAVAVRLNTALRSVDTIARISGDEFVIILNELSSANEAGIIANKIIEIMNNRFLVHGHELHISCSIGITLYPKDSDDISELMKKSDLAMYAAKEAGRNQFRFYH